jgi:FkbM family methyltransferase
MHIEYKDTTSYRNHDNKDWLWPSKDEVAWKYLTKRRHYQLPDYVASLVSNKGHVVQAGGHCGLYPYKYSNWFEKVYTFEPHPENFYCLNKNIINDNVIKINLALGEKEDYINLVDPSKYSASNTGGYTVNGAGDIKMIPLDSYVLEGCDLLHLDLEGFEWFALKGSVKTVKEFKPILVLETNDYCEMHGYSVLEMEDWIKNTLNYKILEKLEHDTVYAPI